jgi:hypothetical protein
VLGVAISDHFKTNFAEPVLYPSPFLLVAHLDFFFVHRFIADKYAQFVNIVKILIILFSATTIVHRRCVSKGFWVTYIRCSLMILGNLHQMLSMLESGHLLYRALKYFCGVKICTYFAIGKL